MIKKTLKIWNDFISGSSGLHEFGLILMIRKSKMNQKVLTQNPDYLSCKRYGQIKDTSWLNKGLQFFKPKDDASPPKSWILNAYK